MVTQELQDREKALRKLLDRRGLGPATLESARAIWADAPSSVVAGNILGRSLDAVGATEETLEHWRTMLEQQPGNSVARNQLARLESRLKYATPAKPSSSARPRAKSPSR